MDDLLPKRTALIIANDGPFARLASTLFELEGFRVHRSRTVEKGIDAIRRKRIHFLLLDLGFATSNGWRVLEAFKSTSRSSKVPVVVVTESDGPQEKEKALDMGVQAYLLKPVDVITLKKAITNSLHVGR